MAVQGLSIEPVIHPAHEFGTIERFEPGRANTAVTALAAVAALGGFCSGMTRR
jgi:hypothetical protein